MKTKRMGGGSEPPRRKRKPTCRRSEEKPSFFKVLSNMDFSKLLRVPPTFLRRYELNLPENVKLRVDDSGRSWNVKMERLNNGLFCFTNGWKKFAEDADLQMGEFLVFSLLEKSEFNVVIYETSCCKREIPTPWVGSNAHDVEEETKVGIKSYTNCFFKKGNPLYFATCLKLHHRSRVSLPKEFAKASNMKVRKQVRVEYVGNSHGVSVAVDPRPQGYRTDLAKGWPQFRLANGLVYGKIYSFEFNPSDQVIYVKEVARHRYSTK